MPCEKCFSVQCLYWELLIAHVSPLQTQGNRDLVGEISNICSGFVTLRSPTHLLVGKLSFKPNQAPILHFSCVSLFEQIRRCMSGLFGLFVCGGSCVSLHSSCSCLQSLFEFKCFPFCAFLSSMYGTEHLCFILQILYFNESNPLYIFSRRLPLSASICAAE